MLGKTLKAAEQTTAGAIVSYGSRRLETASKDHGQEGRRIFLFVKQVEQLML
jgi:hypothetical protein